MYGGTRVDPSENVGEALALFQLFMGQEAAVTPNFKISAVGPASLLTAKLGGYKWGYEGTTGYK